jgi:hypothetical protein
MAETSMYKLKQCDAAQSEDKALRHAGCNLPPRD